jgi:hypothetical protein
MSREKIIYNSIEEQMRGQLLKIGSMITPKEAVNHMINMLELFRHTIKMDIVMREK